MTEVLVVLLVFLLLAFGAVAIRGRGDYEVVEDSRAEQQAGLWGAPSSRVWPLLAVLVALALLVYWLEAPLWIAFAIAVAAGVSVSILLSFLAKRKIAKLQMQLAEGIDLIVMSLRAGGSLSTALLSAARETRRPFRIYLNELVERIRLGESPNSVLADLEERIPHESFRLFSYALAAHWEGGGSLASTLANVGRTIRDRVDLTRRVSSQAVESQVSVFGVLAITYGLALLMWNNYPERFETFASSELGSAFIAITILMQGVGVFWISRLTRIEV